jgi:GDPmannose 4,6-dehydratase
VTRKISQGVAKIKLGMARELRLGNLAAKRDWGFAGDYVKAMWQMLNQDQPEDYVIATGAAHSVEDFCRVAFDSVGLNWQEFVKVDQAFIRPAEVDHLLGDCAKARAQLGWKIKVSFEELVAMMVDHDVYRIRNGLPIYATCATEGKLCGA